MFFALALRKLFQKSPVRRREKQTRLRIEALEDRTVPATWNVGTSNYLSTISSSVHSGDTIQFAPGTYTQQIVLTQNNVTLLGGTGVILAPSSVAPATVSGKSIGGGAAIQISGTNDVVSGFTVTGANANSSMWFGILVYNGGSATVKNNVVESLLNQTAYLAGADVGIQVGTSAAEVGYTSAGTAKVDNNTIQSYAGAGVEVDGSQADAIIQGNTIAGSTGYVDYGVQVSNGASARVQLNSISGNIAPGSSPAPSNPVTSSAGIFFYNDSGHQCVAALNTITGNDDGVLVQGSSGSCFSGIQIVNNTISCNIGYAGIFVMSSSNIEVTANCVSGNTTYNGIALNGTTGVLVSSNDVSGTGTCTSQSDGIYDQGGTNDQIFANNSFSNSGNGINLNGTSSDELYNNVTWANTMNGIQDIGGSSDAIWLGSSVVNSENGILLNGTSSDTVVGDVLFANGQYGLKIIGASNTFVANNLVVGNNSGQIYTDCTDSGTVLINNWTGSAPVKDGTSGVSGSSNAYTNSFADADNACSGLCN